MSFLQQLTPLNLQEEKQKFFSDPLYNPQFIYAKVANEDRLKQYPTPNTELVLLAKNIIANSPLNKKQINLEKTLGRLLSQKEVTKKAQAFLAMHGLTKRIEIVWSASFVSRATINKNTLKLKSLAQFRERETAGLLFHEIGTHALRQVNYEQQPWYLKKKQFGFANYLETEEGLATLHSLLVLPNKSLHKSAIRYLAADFSRSHSFAELWQYLTPYISNKEERWMVTLRQKRGIRDTTQPSIFMKDALYFSGAVKMARWLSSNGYDLTGLYYGKLAVEDVVKAIKLNPSFSPKLPSFFVTNKETYQKEIQAIINYNCL